MLAAMSEDTAPRKHAPIKLMVEKVDKSTGEIGYEFYEGYGAAFPQREGRQLALKFDLLPLGGLAFVPTEDLGLLLPEGVSSFPIRAARDYIPAGESTVRRSWSTAGWATPTRKGLVLRVLGLPPSYEAVIFFWTQKQEGEG